MGPNASPVLGLEHSVMHPAEERLEDHKRQEDETDDSMGRIDALRYQDSDSSRNDEHDHPHHLQTGVNPKQTWEAEDPDEDTTNWEGSEEDTAC
jgi:hypothetical protein